MHDEQYKAISGSLMDLHGKCKILNDKIEAMLKHLEKLETKSVQPTVTSKKRAIIDRTTKGLTIVRLAS